MDLKLIKKNYGENMMHLCRELFPTILEYEGKLFELLSNNFAYSKFLYDDIINNDDKFNTKCKFKDFIYNLYYNKSYKSNNYKSVSQLFDEAGYNFYECRCYEDVMRFKKYYYNKEILCTFNNVDYRLKNNYVFFAVKKDVDNINRIDFPNPKREDLYGTSVISIQFTRGLVNTLSIKNRYNHSVSNPDATFSNNLDNIIVGLTDAFTKEYNLNINSYCASFEIPGYVKANDGKFYKYNYEIDNIYYCPNNIIIENHTPIHFEKEKYIILDYFVLDMKKKKIITYDDIIYDSFCVSFDKIDIIKEKEYKKIILDDNIVIVINKYNQIIEYSNNNIKLIDDNFLQFNETINNIELPNVIEIKDNFLAKNDGLINLSLPNVKTIGDWFLDANESLKEIDMPNVLKIGDNFLTSSLIEKLSLPNLRSIGDDALFFNIGLSKLELPNILKIGDSFLQSNEGLSELCLPSVDYIGNSFLLTNNQISKLELPNVKYIGNDFLYENKKLSNIKLDNVKYIGYNFIYENEIISEVELPVVEKICIYFLYSDNSIKRFIAPMLKDFSDIDDFYDKNIELFEVSDELKNSIDLEEQNGVSLKLIKE